MDLKTKIVIIIVLVSVLVVYIVSVGRGTMTSDQPKNTNQDDSKNAAANFNRDSLPGGEAFKELFSGLQETVALCEPKPDSERRCDALMGNITIPPYEESSSSTFSTGGGIRTVELEVLSGIAVIEYRDSKGIGKIDNPQKFELPDTNKNNTKRNFGSIVISEAGGTLTISCKLNIRCQVGQP